MPLQRPLDRPRLMRFDRLSWQRLCRTLLLPLLLLCSQQGAFLHELSHYSAASAQGEDHRRQAGGTCELCLAFDHVQSAAPAASQPPPLLSGLRFALVATAPQFVHAGRAPALRNRGPPTVL